MAELETITIPPFVTFEETGAILGGISTRSVERLVASGRLRRVWKGQARRIVGASLCALLNAIEDGEALCPDDLPIAEPTAKVQPTRTRKANGSPAFRSETATKQPAESLRNKRATSGARISRSSA